MSDVNEPNENDGKLKNVDSSRFQKGLKSDTGQDSGNESGQGISKQQEEELEQGM